MTAEQSSADCRASYDFALQVERLRMVVAGDVAPRLEEPVDIVLMAELLPNSPSRSEP